MFHDDVYQQPRSARRLVTAVLLTLISQIVVGTTVRADRLDAPELKQVPVPIELVDSIATRLSLQYHGEPGVSISADDRGGGALLVMAPPSVHRRIAADAQALIQRMAPAVAGNGKPTSMTVHLIHITWREAEDVLHAIAGGNATVTTSRNGERASFQISLGNNSAMTQIEVDRRSNQIVVTTGPASIALWQSVFSAIDTHSRFADEQLHVHRLVHAEVAAVQRTIRLLRNLDQNPSDSSTRSKRSAGLRGGATVQAAGFRTVAFQQNDEIRQEEADGEEAEPTPAADVALSAGADAEGGVIGDTDIQIVPDSGLIIIKGAKQDVERIKKVIAEIEAQAKITQPDVEVRQLQHADSNAVATLLSQLYQDVLSARQGDVSITSLDAPNALLLIGRAEAIKAVMDLIDKIDQPIPETDRLRVFRLQHASATDAEATIREFFTNKPGEDSDPRPGLGQRVRISSDFRTNSLIVAASPRDMGEVTRLVEQLDVQRSDAASQIRIFPLRNARAEDLAPVLRDAITAEPENIPNDTTPKSTALSIVSLGAAGNPVLDSGILFGTVITADNNANAIVVRAPSEGMPLIAELIRQLDQAPGIGSLVKVFTIENSDATKLTTALQNLFGDEAGTSGTSIGAANQVGLPALSASSSSLVPLRFSTDARTNSIIASGSAEDLEVVESILLRLDSTGFAERITEVIWLKNQVAANIATAIQEYVNVRLQTQNVIPQLQQGLGPYDLPDRDLIVVAEEQTNSLLLSVSPRMYEEVRRLIDRLDRRPPMVLIKTLIAEVRLDDGFELGGELGLQDSLLFDRGIASIGPPASSPGFNFNGTSLPNSNSIGRDSLASRGVTAFGVAQSALDPANNGGFVFSAASESISLFLRTLQTANRLQVLSRPEVMTADNTEGFVTVGQSFPRPTSLSTTQFGTQIGIEDVEVGVILRVTPRVGADGLILMDIDASRKSVNFAVNQVIGFSSTGQPGSASQPISVPAIDQTIAQSTITAFDGQTVVFGGLIQKRRENITRRVPYLASIPLLGTFFKYDRELESRSELLIVMTPMLVTGDEDLEYVKQIESSRMSWCLADVVEAHGDEGLNGGYGLWGPAIGPTIFPDIQPTVDVFPAADMPKNSAIRSAVPMYGEGMICDPPLADSPLAGEHPGIPGVQLAPGESIITHSEMLSEGGFLTPEDSQPYSVEPYGELPPTSTAPIWGPELQAPQLPVPAPELQLPGGEPPAPPVQRVVPRPVPAAGASTSLPATPSAIRTVSATAPPADASIRNPARAEEPKRWSSFSGKMGSFISPSK